MKNLTLPILGLLFAFSAPAQTVRFSTNLGNIDVKLDAVNAPLTVANFLTYVNSGAYKNSVFHRSVAGFIIQGGGFTFDGTSLVAIPQNSPVKNEFKVSNTRGTIAMAKLGSDPNSATNQWFFNLSNSNASNLDAQNGGFTVFGQIVDSTSLSVMDKIAAVPVYNQGSLFDSIPLQNYKTSAAVTAANFITVSAITLLDDVPTIAQNGVISASGFGGLATAAPGSYIEIYGSKMAGTTRQWGGSDFVAGKPPTTLDGVSVTIDGKAAYVYSVSPGQVNIQVPANVRVGIGDPVVVSYNGLTSSAGNIIVRRTAPGLLAPAGFKVGDKQYVVGIHANGSFVSSGNIPGVAAAPAIPGETLTFYGIGFGPVTPGEVAGQIASGTTSLQTDLEFDFGDRSAQTTYAGLAPGLVGLYQFNVVVPAVTGDVPLQVYLGGQPLGQTLYISVQN